MIKAPIPTENLKKKQSCNTKTSSKCSVTQRLRTDLGQSVGVTITTGTKTDAEDDGCYIIL